MHLEHLNLVVKEFDNTLAFYQAAFPHWKIRGKGEQDWYGKKRQWLHFGDDYQYITFNNSGTGENRNLQSNNIGLGHFAYVTHDLSSVIRRLTNAGFKDIKEGANSKFRKNIYFVDPNGYEIEFVEYLSDIPAERNIYE